MPKKPPVTPDNRPSSTVLDTFLEQNGNLKRFVGRFFSNSHDVDDVTQETYLRAYVAEQSREIAQPKSYLFQAAKNIALDKLKRKSRQVTDFIAECDPSIVIDVTSGADRSVEAEQTLGICCDAVASLPAKCREAFLLRKVHGLSHKEIAERMSVSLSSVEKYVRQGLLVCEAYLDRVERSTNYPLRKDARKDNQGTTS